MKVWIDQDLCTGDSIDLETFKCCRCKEHQSRDAFGGITKRNDYCKSCSLKITRDYRAVNRDKTNATNRACASRRYATNRANLIAYLKEHPCVDCGETDIIVLEFDHRDPLNKRASIGKVLGSWTWKTLLTEIEKCDVRCANDHRRRTTSQFGWFKGGDAL